VGDTSERASSRPLRAAAAGLALAGLLAVVALAARGGHPGGHARLHERQVPAQAANDLLTIVVIIYVVAVIALFAVAYWLRGDFKPPKRSWWQQLLLLLLVMFSLTVLGYRLGQSYLGERLRRHIANVQPTQTGVPTTRTPTLPARPVAKKPAQVDWILAAVIGGGLIVLGGVLLVRRRRPSVEADEETVEAELSAIVADTIDDLRREADPRRAVIAAYARMERVLAQDGHPRRPSEAPFEYLARVLTQLRVRPAAVRDLTDLFERAKFSTHEIDQAMKERAIASLVSVRDDLAVAPV
jgi:Domain of unknown function (DUF4129)